jgi:hypothetical protein
MNYIIYGAIPESLLSLKKTERQETLINKGSKKTKKPLKRKIAI